MLDRIKIVGVCALMLYSIILSGCAKRECDSKDVLEKNSSLVQDSGNAANEELLVTQCIKDTLGEDEDLMYIDAEVNVQDVMYKGVAEKKYPRETDLKNLTGIDGLYTSDQESIIYAGNESNVEFNLELFNNKDNDTEVEASINYAYSIAEGLNYDLKVSQILCAKSNGINKVVVKYIQKLDGINVINSMGTYDYDNIQMENNKVVDVYLMPRYVFANKERTKILPLNKVIEYVKALYMDGNLTIYPGETISKIEMMYVVDRNDIVKPVYAFLVKFENGYIPIFCFDVENGKLEYDISLGLIEE